MTSLALSSDEVERADPFWHGPDGLSLLTDCGIRVMPVRPGAKVPAWKNWAFGRDGRPYGSSCATTDLERLHAAVDGELRPNIGIPTGQPWRGGYLTAIDIDPRHGGDESFTELCDQIGPPPGTATVRTLNGGTHIYVLSPGRWTDTPKELAPGVEFKRSGQFVMAPPSHGYAWITPPWGDPDEAGISSWHGWESLLGMSVAAKDSGLLEPVARGVIVPRLETWCSVDDYLVAIASAAPGRRTEALLRFGGKIAWATAIGVGLASPAAVAAAIWNACETSGLSADYSAVELGRKIEVFETWSDPSKNPLLLPREGHKEASRVIGHRPAEGAETAVFLDLGTMARAEAHEYAKRYGAVRTGYSPTSVQNALASLQAKGLIERGASLWNAGKRASNTYKLTSLGNLALNHLRST